MKNLKRMLPFTIFYVINVIGVGLVIWLADLGVSTNIVLALYLVVLTAFFSYDLANGKKGK
ncbi:MAG: hypothetical protein PHC32_00925 [Candidatus Izemoplasmatales bacterium]|nr:hypothetical protein [Candidatus Izemoplasmatales bacterium]